ncbi:MAG TPA: hypothetical protein DCS07_07935 [Bdellovibrionales bacterium]|nr:MAG: hypothetical protein A2Z97_13410 [Bdellovibrionales bacterium GWB1_52_6]OFZ03167.1 MAG: hypothetical protein A2X97_04080 [Bdellovibrionales bacterium GWA1_52_35]OFZ37682.1 MAG: hypothetical protein A2070_01865 [Bdellovibrionales bacterium GWC1_52_8]HAR42546.1 hypothetical protein [Bdellovibrionales bacterium]HCM38340.1 hypothetical protein [Bdellovibrionales bacterium]
MKYVTCRNLGKECDFVAEGSSESDVVNSLVDHGIKAHGMKEEDFTPEFRQQVESKIRDREEAVEAA